MIALTCLVLSAYTKTRLNSLLIMSKSTLYFLIVSVLLSWYSIKHEAFKPVQKVARDQLFPVRPGVPSFGNPCCRHQSGGLLSAQVQDFNHRPHFAVGPALWPCPVGLCCCFVVTTSYHDGMRLQYRNSAQNITMAFVQNHGGMRSAAMVVYRRKTTTTKQKRGFQNELFLLEGRKEDGIKSTDQSSNKMGIKGL